MIGTPTSSAAAVPLSVLEVANVGIRKNVNMEFPEKDGKAALDSAHGDASMAVTMLLSLDHGRPIDL